MQYDICSLQEELSYIYILINLAVSEHIINDFSSPQVTMYL